MSDKFGRYRNDTEHESDYRLALCTSVNGHSTRKVEGRRADYGRGRPPATAGSLDRSARQCRDGAHLDQWKCESGFHHVQQKLANALPVR